MATDAALREQFKIAVIALDMRCVASRPPIWQETFSPCEGPLHAHHIVTQQQLRQRGLSEYTWDPRVGAAVCERHHRRHHNRAEPMRRSDIPIRTRDFIIEFDLDYFIERYYAETEDGIRVS